MTKDFLGVGWKFPVDVDEGAQISKARYEESIRQAIWIILATAKGERVMRPDFGCGIHELVFAQNNATTAGMAAFHVKEALSLWEPRIELITVDAFPEEKTTTQPSSLGEKLIISIEYRVIATNSIFNLVYPFYLTEGAGS